MGAKGLAGFGRGRGRGGWLECRLTMMTQKIQSWVGPAMIGDLAEHPYPNSHITLRHEMVGGVFLHPLELYQ